MCWYKSHFLGDQAKPHRFFHKFISGLEGFYIWWSKVFIHDPHWFWWLLAWTNNLFWWTQALCFVRRCRCHWLSQQQSWRDPLNPCATTLHLQRVIGTWFLFEMMGFKHLNTSEGLSPNTFSINVIKFCTRGAQMPDYFVINTRLRIWLMVYIQRQSLIHRAQSRLQRDIIISRFQVGNLRHREEMWPACHHGLNRIQVSPCLTFIIVTCCCEPGLMLNI